MKSIKKMLCFVLFLTASFTLFGWGITPHSVIAYLGYKDATPQTKAKILPLLKSNPSLPGNIKCYVKDGVKNPDSFMASAVAPWPDPIKYLPAAQWGNAGANAENFYSNCHFMDTPFRYGTTEKLDPKEAMITVLKQINETDGKTKDDLYYLYKSCVKSLAMSQDPKNNISKDEQIFSLRHLIHLSGDCTQPLHMSDPIYSIGEDTKLNNSYGGNTISFIEDVNTKDLGYKQQSAELHDFWDNPGKFTPFLPWQTTDTEIYIDLKGSLFIKHLADLLEKKYSGQRKGITEGSSTDFTDDMILGWITETYGIAVSEVCKGLSPVQAYTDDITIDLGNKGTCSPLTPNTSIKTGSSVIDPPTKDYGRQMEDIAEIQIYKGGVRLSNLLNAIYDPEHAPENYIIYINGLLSNDSIPTVNQLCQVFPNQK